MNVYDFDVKKMNGEMQAMRDYEGKVLLIVNTASKCGFTPQFEGLEKLYQAYGERGLVIVGFPCNQFAGQDPGTNEEIKEFCSLNYGVTFSDDGEGRCKRRKCGSALSVSEIAKRIQRI